jgi:hypothetical protein
MIEEAKNEKEKATAAEALWMLAFDEDNRQEMKRNDDKCIKLLKKLKESDNDTTRKAASGALWEIEGKQHVIHTSTSSSGMNSAMALPIGNVHQSSQSTLGK